MTGLSRIKFSNIRNIDDCSIDGLSRFNVFYGVNGAGKTSLLEAIAFLGMGRSFRSRNIKSIIKSDKNALLVFGELNDGCRLGVKRSSDKTALRVDGKSVLTSSVLAEKLPLLIIDANTFSLLLGGPSKRREFIDWGLFHVEHGVFHKVWSSYHKALKQRNELLKRGTIDKFELRAWDVVFCRLGEQLSDFRCEFSEKILKRCSLMEAKLDFGLGSLTGVLKKGWPQGYSFSEALEKNYEKDIRYKNTTIGPHKFDIEFKFNNVLVQDLLSRGQLKTLATVLKLDLATFVTEKSYKEIILLFDDLPAETDDNNRKKIASYFNVENFQVFVTGIGREDLIKALPNNINVSMFHVEHGVISKE